MTFLLFSLWTFVLFGRPQDFFPALAPVRPALTLGLLTAIALLLGKRTIKVGDLLRVRETKLYLLFYLVLLAGIPVSFYRGQSLKFLFLTYLGNMLFYAMVLFQVDSLKRIKQLFFTISLSVLFYASLSLVKGQFLKGRFFAGKMYDPNDLAFFLVSLFPLGILFIVQRGGLKKMLALATVGLAIATVLLTASRGGLLGLATVLAVLLLARTGNPLSRPPQKMALVLIAAAAIAVQASKINVERYATLGELGRDYNVTAEDGRLTIWRRGLELVARNPVFGVGADCFPQAIGEMREKQGGSPMWQVAHNAYLQIAAEAGLPGLFLFLAAVTATYRSLSRARGMPAGSDEARELATIAGALSIGFIACLTTAFFLSQAYSILFTLFFALGTAVERLQRQQAGVEAGERPSAFAPGLAAGTER